MKQKELLEILNKNELVKYEHVSNPESEVADITYNSLQAKEGTAFFVKGENFKEEYLMDAVNKGASLIISEKEYSQVTVSTIIVSNIRRAMVVVANEFFGRAYRNLNLIGLTGTKGKTTTAYFMKNILDEYLGKRSAFISTIEVYTGKRDEESHNTTPEAIELQRLFKEASDSDTKFLTMEVTSQAYKVDRIYDMQFDVGVFLNICEDHISPAEHPDFNDYLACKLEFIKNCKNVIINRETDYFDMVKNSTAIAEKVITYGTERTKDDSDYFVDNIVTDGTLTSFDVHSKAGYHQTFKISMKGRFNIENALASIIVAKLYNIDDESISRGLLKTEVQGRMNIFEKDGVTVVVDYAHNKLSYTKLYETLVLDYPGRRIISLTGGPGGKAFSRRRDVAEIAGKYSSFMYLTAEDPQFESVVDICNDIKEYLSCPSEIIEDRKEAVEKAILNAKKSDVVVLLAKGEETYQKVRGKFEPYESDIAITKRLLNIK